MGRSLFPCRLVGRGLGGVHAGGSEEALEETLEGPGDELGDLAGQGHDHPPVAQGPAHGAQGAGHQGLARAQEGQAGGAEGSGPGAVADMPVGEEALDHQLLGVVPRGIEMLEPVGGALRRVIPIILAHHDKFDGSGYNPTSGEAIPFEARIIAVADVYDALTSDRPYRKAMSPFEARDVITNGENTEFDPKVVAAFNALFRRGELEIWSAPLSAA